MYGLNTLKKPIQNKNNTNMKNTIWASLIMLLSLLSCNSGSPSTSSAPGVSDARTIHADTVFIPLYTYVLEYPNPKVDTIPKEKLVALTEYYLKFQNDIDQLWVNFRVDSRSMSWAKDEVWPDYALHLRRMAYVMDWMVAYFGSQARITTELQIADRPEEKLDAEHDRLIIEFGTYK